VKAGAFLVLLWLTAPPEAPSPLPADGLVLHWSMESGAVPTLPQDGVALCVGPAGRALEIQEPLLRLGGSDVKLPAGAAPGTISLWFARPAGESNKVLCCYGSRVRGAARGLWIVHDDQLCFYFFGHPQDLHAKVPGGIEPGRWHHVAATYDSATAKLYYDGKLLGQVKVKIDTARDGRFRLGYNLEQDDGRDFVGHVDEVAVYGRALSAEEIRAYHAALAGKLPPLPAPKPPPDLPALLGVREIVFAVRKVDSDGHWYANFGPHCVDPGRRYYHDGGRLCRLDLATGKVTALIDDPAGGVRDPQLSYDAKTILFSYRKGGQPHYHLYEIGVDGSNVRRLTDGPYDDIEPTYMPDGSIVFVSSRCNRWVPCYITQVAVLHRCDLPAGGQARDGRNIRQLSANVEHENTPWPLPDGRVLYQRWEYVDRSQVGYHHLWTMNPDGSGAMVLYGNLQPNVVMIDAKPIPGTGKVVASFSPGHGRNEHSGQITIIDPSSGPDNPGFARPIGRGHFRDPYPLSEKLFLAADATGGGSAGTRIVALSAGGRVTPVYQLSEADARAGLKVHEPRPVTPRPREPVIADKSATPAKGGATGTVLLENIHVGRSMEGIEPGQIKRLLVLEILPKPINIFSGMEPLTYGGTFLLERIVGTVPVEPDGSAYVELPAMRPMFFAALDANDLCVKRMQSFITVQGGESVSCVGCHEQRYEAPRSRRVVLASRRPPSVIEPVAGVPDVIDFPRDIQPILDRHCVRCHGHESVEVDGKRFGPMAGGLLLAGDRGPMFSHSYYGLTMAGQLADGRNLRRSNYPPRTIGSSASPLLARLDGAHHGARLSEGEKRIVRLWLDSGSVYAGTYAALGTGSIGNYRNMGIDRSDLQWPETKAARAAIQRRCAPCHKGNDSLPDSPSDNKGMVPWGEGPMNALALHTTQRLNPHFRYNRHMVYNLDRPERSLMLLAPLSVCSAPAPVRSAPVGASDETAKARLTAALQTVFASADDADYKTILAMIQRAAKRLREIKRFDMPHFRPDPAWVREMKRYGILPPDLPADAPIDVYAAERAYWRSFWK